VSFVASERLRACWDLTGIALSALCIVHCLLLPLAALALPALVWAGDEQVHQVLAAALVVPAAFALWVGHRRHRHRWPVVLAASGVVLVATAAYAELPEWLEIFLTVIGSTALIAAHRRNDTLCPTCRAQAATPAA
jgi:hypothetical protein